MHHSDYSYYLSEIKHFKGLALANTFGSSGTAQIYAAQLLYTCFREHSAEAAAGVVTEVSSTPPPDKALCVHAVALL